MGYVIFKLHLGVGHSVLCQMMEECVVFSNYHIFKCSGPTPHVHFNQSPKDQEKVPEADHLCVTNVFFPFVLFFSRIPFDSLCFQFAFLDGSKKETKITWKIKQDCVSRTPRTRSVALGNSAKFVCVPCQVSNIWSSNDLSPRTLAICLQLTHLSYQM